jgi:uncharacterized membrane protein (DUF106 family)
MGANPPQKSQMLFMLLALGLMMTLFIPGVRKFVGDTVGIVFEPLIGFNGQYIVITLMIAGMLMIGLSSIIRSLMMDNLTQARNQKEMSAFNTELRKARMENNLYKIKKLTEMQPAMMSKSMESSMKMMKTMPITMLIIMPIISWVWIYIEKLHVQDVNLVLVDVPWATDVLLTESLLIPVGILLYMLVTIPFGQIVTRTIRWFQYKKRLEKLDGTVV